MSVAGVVDEAGRVLVIQRRDNARWEASGGILERHETFEEGVAREAAEETGVTVEVDRLTGVYKNMAAGSSHWSTGATPSPARRTRRPSRSRWTGSALTMWRRA